MDDKPLRLKSSWMYSSSTSQKNSLPFSEQNHEIQLCSSSSALLFPEEPSSESEES